MIWIVVLLTWEGAYRLIGWRAYVFPAPSHILDRTLELLNISTAFGEPLRAGWPRVPAPVGGVGDAPHPPIDWMRIPLIQAPLVSGLRLLAGFAVSVLIGAVLGLSMWRSGALDEFLGPVLLGLQTLPSVCWAPLAILFFGLNEQAILFIMVMGSAFAVAIALRDGLRTIPPVYQRAGQMLGAKGWRLYRYVLLPASLPALASSLRQGFAFAWRSLMGAEFVVIAVDHHGLGYLLQQGRDFSDRAQVLSIMILMILLAMLVDRHAFARLERHIHNRFGLNAVR